MIDELARRIWAHEEFHEDYKRLLSGNLRRQFVDNGVPAVEDDALARLLQSASALASSQTTEHRSAAYRIATTAWEDCRVGNPGLEALVKLVLSRLGNFPALRFLFPANDGDDPAFAGLPMPLWLRASSHLVRNSLAAEDSSVVFTDFQRDLWEILEREHVIALSAPTSAGKSFALQRHVVRCLRKGRGWCLYLAPTRALLGQVCAALVQMLKVAGLEVPVSSVPVASSSLVLADGSSTGVYVLTQERLQILRRVDPELRFDLAIVDEAQTVGDEERGVLLQSMLEHLVDEGTQQLVLASPFLSNLNVFRRVTGASAKEVPRGDSPVAQDLVYLDTSVEYPKRVQVSAVVDRARLELGVVEVPHELLEPAQRLANLAWHFGRGDKNIVYAGGQASCEDIAGLIDRLAEDDADAPVATSTTIQAREELAAFVRDHIHPEYLLAETVMRGVAFHYGNMPTLLRSTIEDLFAQGHLDFIVCTSTLLYGVNLPARNVFLLDPIKGEDEPISSSEFWNLAGRAGRLGKDVRGNVFIVDAASWKTQPMDHAREQDIVPSFEAAVTTKTKALLAFMRNREHASGDEAQLETTFVKLAAAAKQGALDPLLQRLQGADESTLDEVRAAVHEAVRGVSVPTNVIELNTGISVFRQQEMMDVIRAGVATGNVADWIPSHPLRANSKASLDRLFKLLALHFEKVDNRSYAYFSVLARMWMRGDPVARIIANAYQRRVKEAKRGRPKVAPVIRKVFREIERDVRFRLVKYTKCYVDLLAEVLRESGRASDVERIPPLPLFLELGASSKSMISFIGLGLSRNTAQLLSAKAQDQSMEQRAALDWLRRRARSLGSLDLPGLCLREVQALLAS